MVDFLLIYWPLFALAQLALITLGSLVIAVAVVLGREAVWVIGFRAYVIAAVIVSLLFRFRHPRSRAPSISTVLRHNDPS